MSIFVTKICDLLFAFLFIETKIPKPALRDLVREVHTTDLYSFGLQLSIDKCDLDTIVHNSPNSVQVQLRKVCNLYLKQTPQPSWHQVAVALHKIGEVRNAADIAQKHGT